ncbi:MAG TPA: DNA polymerase III subunit delta [Nocardioidaceae bacterium]|nr:DNA polymerase III subunit delta [Nocardioidaceae bacterium]
MANPTAADILGRVTLVTGPEEFLRERAVVSARTAVLAADPESEVSETTGDQLTRGELDNLSAPSLFSSVRFAVVRNLEDTPDTSFDDLLEFAAAPPEDVGLVLVHSGGPKGSGLLTKLRKISSVTEVKSEALKASEFPRFVSAEVRRHGGRIEEDAAELLVQAVGQDLRALAGAASQLAGDFPDHALTMEVVGRYFSGRAEVKSYVIADHALYGRTAKALEELRWALESGVGAPAITGSFAASVRGLARVKTGDQSGVPPWKVKILREQARGWDERGLARAITAVATADADVKGAGSDAAYALERMVLTICAARTAR